MTMQRRTRQQGLFEGAAWPRDNTSDFEYESPPDSPMLSSGYESIISEDLDLYDPSLEVTLTEEQVSALNGRLDDFKAADYKSQQKMVKDFLGRFKSAWTRGIKFDERTVETLIQQYLYGKIRPVARHSTPDDESPTDNESEDIVLTDHHMSILKRNVPKFRAADTNHREKIIEEAADKVKNAWREGAEFDRQEVISLIRRYLYGKIKRGPQKTVFETRRWTYFDVVTAMHRKKISKLSENLSQNKPGSPAYLQAYKKARKEVEKNLTDNQRQRYKAMAKEWTEKQLPPKMQQRMMVKNGPKAIKDFTSLAYKEFGMRVVVLAAFKDDKGDASISLFDYNDKNGGTSFKARLGNWRQHEIMDDFAKWGTESFGVSPANDSEDEPERKQTTPEIKLKRKRNGYPILPSLEEIKTYDLAHKKRLIGRFISDVYGMSLGSGKRRVPWSQLERAQGNYIKPKYLPKQVAIRQNYHLRLRDANAILEHWAKRKASGKTPFRFRKEANEIQQNEPDLEEDNSDSPMRSGEESEGVLQGDNSRQAGEDGGSNGSAERAHSLNNATENVAPPSNQSLDNGQWIARPSTAADVHEQQQTDGLKASQTDEIPTNDGHGRPGSAELGPSPNDVVIPEQTDTHELQPSPLGLSNATDGDQQPPPGSAHATDECAQLPAAPANSAHETQQSPPASESYNLEIRQDGRRRLRRSGRTAAVANEGEPSPAAPLSQPSRVHERQKSPSALRSASSEMQRNASRKRKINKGAASSSPSINRGRVELSEDSAGQTKRRSNRDRRLTAKAADERAIRIPTRTRSRASRA